MIFKESDLVKKAQNGDKKSFEVLYTAHRNELYLFFKSRVNNDEIALDLTADTFERIIMYLVNFRCECSFRTWMYSIARNILANHYIQRGKEFKKIEMDQEEFSELPEVIEEEDIELVDVRTEKIKDVLNQLPENYKSIIEMRYIMQMNIQECSDALGITKNNVKVLQNRAIKKAKQIALNI